MFDGFDSQNTSHSFLDYLDWDLWVSEILKYIQRIFDNGLCGILRDKDVTVSAAMLRSALLRCIELHQYPSYRS